MAKRSSRQQAQTLFMSLLELGNMEKKPSNDGKRHNVRYSFLSHGIAGADSFTARESCSLHTHLQVAVNIFRGRDSLQFTSAALQMMTTATLIPIPFYAWPGLELIFAPSGLQPMFYIIGFTFAVGWVSSSFRDKPWLLVIISGSALFGSILALLFILQQAELYNGWDILFTGGFYFSKNKIFGTIGEAQAPDRGVLFASYGPIVAIIAICCAFVLLWRGSRRNKSGLTLLGLWTIIATYMAWTAGRFIINATPAMAVVGGIGISMLWGAANFPAFSKVWRNSGIGTPRSRFRSIWPASKARPGVPAVVMVILMISSQHATFGIDSGIPRGEQSAYEVDQSLYDIAPDILRHEFVVPLLDWGFSAMNSESYKPAKPGFGTWVHLGLHSIHKVGMRLTTGFHNRIPNKNLVSVPPLYLGGTTVSKPCFWSTSNCCR